MEPEPKQKNIETNFTELGTIPDTMSIPVPQNGMPVDGTPEANTKVIDANESNIIPDGSDSVMDKGELRSSNFSSGNAGWRILANGDVEFNNGTFRGTITGSTIYIPNATNPMFSVDAAGNVVAESLRRKDFHWMTFFESIDGYQNVSTGTGVPSVVRSGLSLSTGATSGSDVGVIKGPTGGSNPFTWASKRSFKTSITSTNTANSPVFLITTGEYDGSNGPHFGFIITGTAIHSTNANGTSTTDTDLSTTITTGTPCVLEAVFTPGVDIKYYVNGVLKATITTNIPTSSDDTFSYVVFNTLLTNATAADRIVNMLFYDFWQEL